MLALSAVAAGAVAVMIESGPPRLEFCAAMIIASARSSNDPKRGAIDLRPLRVTQENIHA